MAKVSIIINTVDRPTDLKRCLESVLNQTFRDFEIVVVNNGRGEETRRLLAEFNYQFSILNSQFRIIEDPTKKLSYLFNVGWKNTDPSSIFLAFLADDTEADPDWLQNAVAYLDANADAAAVSGPMLSTAKPPGEMFYLRDLAKKNILTRIFLRLYEYFVMEDRTLEPGYWPQSGAFTMGAGIPLPRIKEPVEIDLLTSGNLVVRREALEKVGGFDENFYFNHADGDLFIRLKKEGFKLIFHPGVTVIHHMRFGPTRHPWILGRDTAFYYLKDVRPKSGRGWIGAFLNLLVFNSYFVFKAVELKRLSYLKGLSGFLRGIMDFFATNSVERNNLLKSLGVAVAFVSLFAFSLRRVFDLGMLAYGDTPPFPERAGDAFKAFFSGWFYQSPGIRLPEMAPVYTLNWLVGLLIALFGGQAVLAQKFFHFLPMPLAFVAMYLVLSRFVPSRPARFLAGFIYSANLVMVGEMLGGSEDNLYTHALFPILILLLYRFYLGELCLRTLGWFSLISSFLFLFSDHFLLLLLPFLVIYVFAVVKEWLFGGRTLGGCLKRLAFPFGGLILVFFLTISYAIDYLKIALPFLSGVKIDPETLRFLKGNVDDTYRHFLFSDILRTGGSYYLEFFGQDVFWARTGFILPLFSFAWWLFPRNRRGRNLKVALIFTLVAAADIFLIDRIRGERLSFLFERFPFLFRLRNPARLTRLLLLCYSVLSALTFSALIQFGKDAWAKKRRVTAVFVSGSMAATVLLISYYFQPFFSGDFTLKSHRGDGFVISPRHRILSVWLAAREREEADFFRVLFVPWNHEEGEIKFYWLFPKMYGVAINYGAYTNGPYLQKMRENFTALAEGRTLGLPENLSRAGIKYLVLNTASAEEGITRSAFDYQTPWLWGAAAEYRKTIERTDGFRLLSEIEGFRIYQNYNFGSVPVDPVLSGQDTTSQAQSSVHLFLIFLNILLISPPILYLAKHYLTALG